MSRTPGQADRFAGDWSTPARPSRLLASPGRLGLLGWIHRSAKRRVRSSAPRSPLASRRDCYCLFHRCDERRRQEGGSNVRRVPEGVVMTPSPPGGLPTGGLARLAGLAVLAAQGGPRLRALRCRRALSRTSMAARRTGWACASRDGPPLSPGPRAASDGRRLCASPLRAPP